MNNEQKNAQEALTEANAIASNAELGADTQKQERWEAARQTALQDAKIFAPQNPGKLPAQFQPGDVCQFVLWDWQDEEITARILRVHFTESKVTYDAQLYIPTYDKGAEYGNHTRIYNVDSSFFQLSNERPHLVKTAE